MPITYGTSAATLLCDVLVERGVCDYRKAFELAQAFDRELRRCRWIDTLDGITFNRETTDRQSRTGRQAAF
ncbi:MAG TPA: hypothetical protein VK009_19410 [Chloroflexota bacterium]|nr:hypothetical protein [Chloroflexota bacterium]